MTRRRAARGPIRAAAVALCLLVPPAVWPPAPVAAQDPEPGTELECCAWLLVPVGARSSALAGAVTAHAGPDAVFRNPAGLAGLEGARFLIHHSDNLTLDEQIDAFSLLFNAFSTTIGISYQLFDKGEITVTDDTRQPTGELFLRDHLVVGSLSIRVIGGLYAGASYRVFQERVDCRGLCGGEQHRASMQAADAGLRWNPMWHPAFEIGLAVVNAGLGPRNPDLAGPFPGRIHLGVAYDVLRPATADSMISFRVALDARDRLGAAWSPTLSIGVELDVQQAVFLRAGYTPGEGLGTGAAVGLELRYDRFDIGVSRSFVNSSLQDSEPFQVSLGLHF